MNIPLNIDWQQILLHLFNFAILAGGLYLLLYRPVKDFMKKREEHYQSMDEAAERARADAAQLQEQYASRLSQADAEIAQKRVEAQRELDQYRAQQMGAARQEAQSILDRAKENAGREHEEMLARAQKELADLAVTATEKLVLKAQGDPYEQCLDLAERGGAHEQPERE